MADIATCSFSTRGGLHIPLVCVLTSTRIFDMGPPDGGSTYKQVVTVETACRSQNSSSILIYIGQHEGARESLGARARRPGNFVCRLQIF